MNHRTFRTRGYVWRKEVLADVEQCCADEAESNDNEKDDNACDKIRFTNLEHVQRSLKL